ncbi:MAG: hypothetical protein ACYSSI_01975 [Planctomycetota bacterium]|jgi:hypothetical protein
MALISSGIDNVRVFELAGGIWSDGDSFPLPRIALVKWRSQWSDKFYHVYVNGEFAGSSFQVEQSQLIIPFPNSFAKAVKVEVFAVEPTDVNKNFTHELDRSNNYSGRVRIVLLRSQNLPFGAKIFIYFDNGTGQIDYDNPLNDLPVSIWPNWQDKAGFGLSQFGRSDFGYDSAGAIGFSKGCFGYGKFGIDADSIEWVSPQLDIGVYKFGVKVVDTSGNESDCSETGQITVIPAPQPAEELVVSLFNKQTNQLVLSIY